MGKKKFVCIECGKIYFSYKENSKYCSKECRRKHLNIDYKCDYCGKEISVRKKLYDEINNGTRKHIYCSKECTNKAAFTSVYNICKKLW